MSTAQYAIRAQKITAVVESPSFEVSSTLNTDASAARSIVYSHDGVYVASALAENVQLSKSADGVAKSPRTLDQANVVALAFSPRSTWLFTFERPVKSDTDVHKNVKAWDVKTGEQVGGWYQKTADDWVPIITADEAHLIRSSGSDISIFSPPLSARPGTRLKVDGQIRGLFLSNPIQLPEQGTVKPLKAYSEPGLAVWIGERKGAPASVALYPLSQLLGTAHTANAEKTETRDMPLTQARKAFYKADKLTVKWSTAGNMALFLTHTDVDNTGKSYYGETNLYLVSLDGSFDGLVDLDKEGPIYDFAWNPTSRDFTVCYGYMPSRTQIFDRKAKPLHSFGNNHRNFVAYQPQGRLLLSAGFGNLAGGVDVWEVSTRKKIAEFKASNSSHCEWSPCGRYIMTATLSPRLRVDNGVRIWWAGGQLIHIHPQDDLYQATWRPMLTVDIPDFPAVVPKAPEPNPSVAKYRRKDEEVDSGAGTPKIVGAYRPPGARGTQASDAYKRDDDSAPSSGASTPMFRGGKPGARYVPGGGVPGAPSGEKEKPKKKKSKKKAEVEAAAAVEEVVEKVEKVEIDEDAAGKKIRNLTKKLKAIDELKARQEKGEQLEKTQLMKIETEGSVREEIRALGGEA